MDTRDVATRITSWPFRHLLALALAACASDPAAPPDTGSSDSTDVTSDVAVAPDVPLDTPDLLPSGDVDAPEDTGPLDVGIGPDIDADDVAVADAVELPDATLEAEDSEPTDASELDVAPGDATPNDVDDVEVPDTEVDSDSGTPDVAEPPDLGEPDVVTVPTPTLIEAGPTPDLAVQELLVLPTHAVGPRGPAVLAFTDDGALLLEGAVKTPLGATPVMPSFVEALSDELAVAAGPDGVWVLDDEASLASPIGAALQGAPITGLAVRPGASPTLWLSAGATLWRHQDGLLEPLDAPGFDATGAALAIDAGGGLWGAGPAGVFRVVSTALGADIVWVRPDLVATDIAIDGLGRVWVVAEGDLHLLDAGVWSWLRLPSPVTAVDASPSVEAVWLVVGTDAWFMLAGQFLNVASLEGDAYVALDAEGRGLLADSARLRRVTVSPKEELPPDVTWTGDIEPLFQAKCAKCHGEGQFASPKYTREAWIEQFDNILDFVSLGAMPLPPNPPLESADIQRIKAWKDEGFPE